MEINELYDIFRKCGKVATDSRKVAGGELFFALKGENFDGNLYAAKALEAGAAYAVVDADSQAVESVGDYIDSSGRSRIIPVPSTLETLQALARHHRENVRSPRLPVIGITGTNGKTTTKELIRSVLAAKFNVKATEGNLNNDIGVPLTILSFTSDVEIAVVEMGASHPDDIEKLVKVSEPDYGIITNVGKAHLLGFGSFDGVKKAKGALYDYVAAHDGEVFVNADDPDLVSMAESRSGMVLIPYGIENDEVEILPVTPEEPFLRLGFADGRVLKTSLVGSYNSANVLAALCIGRHFGVDEDAAFAAISSYTPSNSRSQMVRTADNTLIVDAYNANPSSMRAALDNFSRIEASHKTALLGDMRELGENSVNEHIDILRLALSLGISDLCLVG
ncbi:MAG: UDP-N-acetylmuramoyl-tripeptide--D-alanyl-D-alanine ligase, partial [Candidatus Cryptobacteroides sp.]|nr:UDP-N-acetylmuramoyl-tripeptide--D-alanyl-D-alanine ligase [Bacteroidales bacterium]MDY5495874.1 UDP-N-acetylmuramoyl-tripeptide--D-alanyl-D-alanine ligase [Candidatus Cryptobacteroides sp.]